MEDFNEMLEVIDNFKIKNEIVIEAHEAHGNKVKGMFYPWLTVCGSKAMVAYKQTANQPIEYKHCYLTPDGFESSKDTYYYKTYEEALAEGIRIAYRITQNGK